MQNLNRNSDGSGGASGANGINGGGPDHKGKRNDFSDMFKGSPFIGGSFYKNNFVDFNSGGPMHEKRPHYPLYNLPFNGESTYGTNFDPSKQTNKVMEETPFEANLKKQLKIKSKKG